jgi:hypothetical protein
MANPTVPFSWQMPEPTDLVTNLPADFEVFGQAVATDLQYLLGGTTGQVLAKASGTDLDFDWVTDASGMTNPMTTTADVIYSSSGSTPARLGIGTANQVLAVNSGATAPEWQTISSGGMTLLSTTTLSGASTTISSISGAYKDLIIIGYGLNATNSTQPYFQPLSTNIADYSSATTYGATAAVENFRTSALHFTGGQNIAPSNTDNGFQVQITQYASTNVIYKPFMMTSRVVSSASPSTMTIMAGGSINTASAIDSFKLGVGTGTITGTILIYGVN